MTINVQETLDYSNQAQYRVVADTRCLTKSYTLTTVAGQQLYDLPSDVLDILAVLDGAQGSLGYVDVPTALAASSLTDTALLAGVRVFVVGRKIGLLPEPDAVHSYVVWYHARPAALTSEDEFEVTGDFERALERLVQAMKLEDDGQPELAAAEKLEYASDLARLRQQAALPMSTQGRVIGFDQMGNG